MTEEVKRNARKVRQGVVVSDVNDKTIVVQIPPVVRIIWYHDGVG